MDFFAAMMVPACFCGLFIDITHCFFIDKFYKFFVLSHPLNSIGITKYLNYELKLNGVFSRDNLPDMKYGAYVTNLDENATLEYRLKKIDEAKNYLSEEIKHDLMSTKYKKMRRILNYVEYIL